MVQLGPPKNPHDPLSSEVGCLRVWHTVGVVG